MGKVFTLVSGLLLVVAIGLWGYGAFVVGAEAADAQKRVSRKKEELEGWAKDAKNIKNQHFIDDENNRTALLKEEEKKLLELMKSRQVKIDPAAADLPTAQFRLHVTAKYNEEDAALESKGILFTKKPELRGHTYKWDEVTDNDKVRILRDLVVTSEIAKALANATGTVTYQIEDKTIEEKRKIDKLNAIRFVKTVDRGDEVVTKEEEEKPYEEQLVSIEIHAHYNVLIEALREMEASKKCLFVVRGVALTRLDVIPQEIQDEGERAIYKDLPEHEIPVAAEVTLALLEFPEKPAAQPEE